MAKVCKVPGCSNATTPNRGTCEHHQKVGWRSLPGFQERYGISGSKWQSIRAAKIKAAGNRCFRCRKRKDASKLEVDHLRSKKDHSPGNLRVLCKDCHAIKTKRQAAEGRARYHAEQRRQKRAKQAP